MSGLVKAKKYDWKDSNMALFGSDTDKSVKKESAETEPAWEGAGQAPGLKVWRIEKFEVKDWPEEDYGEFYSGDSYIILNTYKQEDSDALLYDVHFWIGKYSSQDEYGTAAYKTVELDTLLDDKPVQHRECQDHEGLLFKSYFPQGISTMKGGSASGFRHVTPEEYVPRLFRVRSGPKGVESKEINRCRSLVTPDDVFILDVGDKVYQYNGENANIREKSEAMQVIGNMKTKRGEIFSEVLDGASVYEEHPFFQALDEEDDEDDDGEDDCKKLLRVDTGSGEAEVVSEGDFGKDSLQSDDVFLVESPNEVFVWVGANASNSEKRNGLPYAHNYLRSSGFPWKSITVVKEGQTSAEFESAIAA